MLGLRPLLRTVTRRGLAQLPAILALWFLLTSSVTLFAAAVAYGDTSVSSGLEERIAAAPVTDRGVRVQADLVPASAVATSARVERTVRDALGATATEVDAIVRADTMAPAGAPLDDASRLTVIAAYEALDRHAALVAGRWAAPSASPWEATLSEGAAAAMNARVGDVLALESRVSNGVRAQVRIVGIWRPARDDGYWSGDRLERTGVDVQGRYTFRGPLVVDLTDLASWPGASLKGEWRLLVAPSAIGLDRLDAIGAAIGGLQDRLGGAVPDATPFTVSSSLPAILSDAGRSALVSRAEIVTLTLQFGILGGYALLLVAGVLVDRRRDETAQLRARGATSARLAGLALVEAIFLAVPAAVVGSFLGGRLVVLLASVARGASSTGPRAAAPLFAAPEVAAVAAAIAVVVLVIPAIASAGPLAGVRAAMNRQLGRTLSARLGIDAILALVAAVALWQLNAYGSALTRNLHGRLGVDPLLVAAPALGLLAAALMAMRLGPRLAEIADSTVNGRRDLLVPLLGHQLGRRPLRYTRAALLLILAAALGTFVAAYSATWDRSQAEQADYQAPGGARFTPSSASQVAEWAAESSLGSVDGVDAALAVTNADLTVGQAVQSGKLLAVDAAGARKLPALPAEAVRGLDALAAARPNTPAATLPGRPAQIAITFDASLAVPPDPDNLEFNGMPLPPRDLSDGTLRVSVVVASADGLYRFEGGTGKYIGKAQTIVVPFGASGVAGAPPYPLRLQSLELAVVAPQAALAFAYPAVPVTGELAVRSLAVTDSPDARPGSGTWSAVPIPETGWRWERLAREGPSDVTSRTSGATLSIPAGSQTPIALFGGFAGPEAMLRYWAAPDDVAATPVLASDGLMQLASAHLGDPLLAASSGNPLPIRPVAASAVFPPLDPATPFVVADRLTLQLASYARDGTFFGVSEWWLRVAPGTESVAAAVAALPIGKGSTIVERSALRHNQDSDPVAIGLAGALVLGAIAALVIAAVGFLASATISATERLREFALLRALGLSSRAVASSLAVENVLLLAFGLSLGTALGALLAWIVLPHASFTPTGDPPVPVPEVVLPWQTVAPVEVAAAVVLLAGAVVVAWRASRSHVAELLRREEL